MIKQLFIFISLWPTAHQQHLALHPTYCRNVQYVSMYVFKDKTEHTIINYCEMCFVSVFHRHPGISFETQQLDGKAHDQRRRTWGVLAPRRLVRVTLRHVVFLSSHYRVTSGHVKCNGACMIRSCSWAKIQLYCGRKGRSHGHRGCCFNIYYL